MAEYQNIHVTVQDRVGTLRIDRPPVNALDTPTLRSLYEAMGDVLADDRVKVIIITGTGRAFAAGACLDEFASLPDSQAILEKAYGGQMVFRRIERSPKPVIAAINGRFCLGGGNASLQPGIEFTLASTGRDDKLVDRSRRGKLVTLQVLVGSEPQPQVIREGISLRATAQDADHHHLGRDIVKIRALKLPPVIGRHADAVTDVQPTIQCHGLR